jgi:predicted MFS family arabinose efflux permease
LEEGVDTSPTASLSHGGGAALPGHLVLIFAVRTILNTAHRIVYPFLPTLARGLGVSLAAASGLVSVRVWAGLAAPFVGLLIDRYSRRRAMQAAMLVFALGGLLLVGLGTWSAAIAAFVLYGLAKVLYDPAMRAYIGDTVPYPQRGRAMGIVELSWSGAWLLGVPAAGLMIERFGWRAPWTVLIGLSLVGLLPLSLGLPPAKSRLPRSRIPLGTAMRGWWAVLCRKGVVAVLLVSLLLEMALEIPFVVYGAWMETSFGLGLSSLGLASLVVGLAEASAELSATLLTDRWGKRRSLLAALLGLAVSLALLPVLARLGLVAALAGVALAVLTFEFGFVSFLPLATEVVPEARATLLSLAVTASSLGRMAGALGGGWLWQGPTQGITWHAVAGVACALLAVLVVLLIQDPQPHLGSSRPPKSMV